MTAPFSVILPTVGRPTLAASLRSCDDELVEEVVVSPDGRQAYDAAAQIMQSVEEAGLLPLLLEPISESRMNEWGHPQRNRGQAAARAKWLLYLDDDDVFRADVFGWILPALKSFRPHIFKMTYGSPVNGFNAGDVLWQEPVLGEGNVGTPMFVVPNGALGWWPSKRAGDFAFIEETCRLQGKPVFVDTVIATVRP